MPLQRLTDFVVNSTTLNDQSQSDIVSLSDGSYFTAWQSLEGALGQDIRARVFIGDSTPLANDFLVNTGRANNQEGIELTVLSDDRVVVTWESNTGGASGIDIKGRIFNPDGTPAAAEFTVNSTLAGPQKFADVTALADDRFLVAWETNTELRARIFNANGLPAASDFVLNATGDDVAVSALANGGFVATWVDDSSGPNNNIKARLFKSTGTAAGSEIQVTNTFADAGHESVPVITTLANGGFVVAWQMFGTTSGSYDVRARIYNSAGAPVGADFDVHSPATTINELNPALLALSDGRFAVAWNGDSGTGDSTEIYLRIYSATGTPAGTEMVVNSTTAGLQSVPSLAQLADGRIAVTWTSRFPADSFDSEIRSTIVDPDFFQGTSAADRWTAGNSNSKIFGYGGADVLIGGNGSDLLNGGTGDDQLTGGAGNDKLYGSSGADTLSDSSGTNYFNGGAGVDVIFMGTGADTVISGTGADVIAGTSAGNDRYVYNFANEGGDTITNFAAGDTFMFRSANFGGLSAGILAATRFQSNIAGEALDGDDRFLYNTTTDTLFFDPDGSGAAAKIMIADFTADFALTASNIILV